MPPATTTAHPRGAPSGLLVAVLFVLLTGVLSMHGWGTHGIASAGDTPSAHHSGLAEPQHAAVIASVVGESASADTPALTGVPNSAGMHLAGLCLAVISNLGLVLMLLRALGRRAPLRLSPPRPWHVRRDPGRDRDPPSLARLSVLRR
jgi:hypothetical protein